MERASRKFSFGKKERELVLPPKYGGRKITVPVVGMIEEQRRLTPHNRELKRQLSKADPEEAGKLKVKEALRHIKEEKAKGHIVNGVKTKDFKAHQLPEINALIYGFRYNPDAPTKTR